MKIEADMIKEKVPADLPKTAHLYTLNKIPGKEGRIRIVKFSKDWDYISAYEMVPAGRLYKCNCPASQTNCRHKTILTYADNCGVLNKNDLGVIFDGKTKVCNLIRLPEWMLGDAEEYEQSNMIDLSDV